MGSKQAAYRFRNRLGDRIEAAAANAICNAGGKLLKIVEMQHKYGGKDHEEKHLVLSPPRSK